MGREFITIVSGLPRSGTSMMMQAIEAGGIPTLTDNIRKSDQDNPKGYYEFEAVKKTREDASWLEDAAGKVVKMVYRLLYDLPQDREYRVVFMRRKLQEVLASQKVMLERLGQDQGNVTDDKMAEMFRKQLNAFDQWVQQQDCFRILYTDYGKVLESPLQQFRLVSEFLGGDLDVRAMAAVVDPSLYRQRL
ncbi:MAG: sulfotransferase family protein [Planctomycetota bacterium]|nr:sulfotransferase family protein [Planctomycetota bacterium]